jgi:hypothetical protein
MPRPATGCVRWVDSRGVWVARIGPKRESVPLPGFSRDDAAGARKAAVEIARGGTVQRFEDSNGASYWRARVTTVHGYRKWLEGRYASEDEARAAASAAATARTDRATYQRRPVTLFGAEMSVHAAAAWIGCHPTAVYKAIERGTWSDEFARTAMERSRARGHLRKEVAMLRLRIERLEAALVAAGLTISDVPADSVVGQVP